MQDLLHYSQTGKGLGVLMIMVILVNAGSIAQPVTPQPGTLPYATAVGVVVT